MPDNEFLLLRAVQQADLFHHLVGKALVKNARACPKYGFSISRRISQGHPGGEVAVVAKVLLPVIAQANHERGVVLEVDGVLNKPISLMFGKREARISLYYLEQYRCLRVERGEIGKGECPAEIRRIVNSERFRQKSRSGPERMRAVDIVDYILNLHPGSVLRKR